MATKTLATVNNPHYLASKVEHAFCFERENGAQVNFSVEHTPAFGPIPVSVVYRSEDPTVPDEHGVEYFGLSEPARALCLVVFDENRDEPTIREEITLSYAEARALRDLLNKPEVLAILAQE